MPDEHPLPRPLRLFRAAAFAVSILVIILMGITGWRIREARLRARFSREPGKTFSIAAGSHATVEGFRIEYAPDALRLFDRKERLQCVFTRLATGRRRGWQELQMEIVKITAGQIRLDTFIRPGAPCRGSGEYRVVKPGLRIEFPGDRSVTVLEVPGKSWGVSVETPEGIGTHRFEPGKGVTVSGLDIRGGVTMRKGPGTLRVEQTD